MQLRNFIHLMGGGIVVGAGPVGCADNPYPAAAVEAWAGPPPGADPLHAALACAITAPNPHNLQPWLVDLRRNGRISIHTDPTRVLPETDPFGRQIMVGHGAFLELLVMALAQLGIAAHVTLAPRGDLPAQLRQWDDRPVAHLDLSPGAAPDPLFAQVFKRRTAKTDFDLAQPVSASTLAQLLANTPAQGASAQGSNQPELVQTLRNICAQAGRIETETPQTALESMRLLRVGPEEILRHRDGIAISSPFVRAMVAMGGLDRTRAPARGSSGFDAMQKRFEGHANTAMAFAWITGPNTRSGQIAAGRAHVRMHLQATAQGLGLHPLSQALQEFAAMAPLHQAVHRLLLPQNPGGHVVHLLNRLGYPTTPQPATPRRALADFVRA